MMGDLKVSIIFDAKNGTFKSVVNSNTQAIGQMGDQTQKTSSKTRQFSQSLQQTNNKLAVTNKLAASVGRGIASMAAGIGVGALLREISNTTRSFQVLRATLETATGSKDKAAEAFDRLQKFAAKTPFSVEESIQAFIKLKNLGLDPTEEALNSYGNTASAMGKSLDQFIEAVADASVSEFERLKEFGIKAKNQGDTIAFTFRKTTTEVGNNSTAIEEYLQRLGQVEFAGAMERQASTYDGALSNMGDSWDQFILTISDDGAGNIMENFARDAASSFDFLATNAETVIDVLQVGLVVAAGHAANAIFNKTAATAKDMIAGRAAAQATINQAKTEIRLATAAKRAALGSAQSAAADMRLTVARKALTAATERLNIVNKGFALMSSLVGGLPGLLTIAGFAMFSFATSTDDAADATKRLNEENEKLNPFANYNISQVTGSLARYKNQLEVAIDMADEARVRFKNPFFRDTQFGKIESIEKADAKVKALQETVALLQAQFDKIGRSEGGKPTGGKQDKEALKSFEKEKLAMTERLALLGQTTELAKAEFAVSQGKFAHLLPAQKTVITNLASELDLKNKQLAADKDLNSQAQQLSQNANQYAAALQQKISLTGESSEVSRLNFELEHGALKGITEELEKQLRLKAQLADKAKEEAEAQLPFWEAWEKHLIDTTQSFDELWMGTFDNFAQNMGDAVATNIVEGENFGQAMKNIARGAVKQVISGLVQIGVKKLALAAIEKTIGATGSSLAMVQAGITGASIAVSMAPAAALSSLASFGGNSVPAMAGISATATLTEGLAVAGIAHDGIDDIPKEGTWLLDKGERVVDSRTNEDLKTALKEDSFNKGGDTITINLSQNLSAVDATGMAELLEQQQEVIYNAVASAKADRGEEF